MLSPLKQKLQFIQADASSTEATLPERIWSPEELSGQLERLLLEDMDSYEQIFDWVEVRQVTSTRLCELVAKILKGRRSGA